MSDEATKQLADAIAALLAQAVRPLIAQARVAALADAVRAVQIIRSCETRRWVQGRGIPADAFDDLMAVVMAELASLAR